MINSITLSDIPRIAPYLTNRQLRNLIAKLGEV